MYGKERVPDDSEYGKKLLENWDHFVNLQNIMLKHINSWIGCGSYLIDGCSVDYDSSTYKKQLLFYEKAKTASKALEIGVHGGHSLFIMLLANPSIKITCIDICLWLHTEKCIKYLNENFGNRINLIKGDSELLLPKLTETFDFIHLDGDHSYAKFSVDLNHAYRLSDMNTVFIFDDYIYGVAQAVSENRDKFNVIEVPDCRWNNCLACRIK